LSPICQPAASLSLFAKNRLTFNHKSSLICHFHPDAVLALALVPSPQDAEEAILLDVVLTLPAADLPLLITAETEAAGTLPDVQTFVTARLTGDFMLTPHKAISSWHVWSHRGTEGDRKESTNLYVGNIPYSFTERDVVDLFERFGRLKSVHVPIDRVTGRNKGYSLTSQWCALGLTYDPSFTFVDFEDRRDAEDAYNKYNGYTIDGRRLRIDWDIGLNKKEVRRGPPPPPPEYVYISTWLYPFLWWHSF
jgi:hypothetical protein